MSAEIAAPPGKGRVPADPRKSPSYPQRTHTAERPVWQALLKEWSHRVANASADLTALPPGPERTEAERTYAQMLGAVDQIAEAARRLPMEVGSLYDEDRHRAEQAVAALERLFGRWGKK